MDDRDVADRYWAGRTDRAFTLADLAAAGATLALGSDAPVAPLDPWVAIAAAVGRTRDGREPWHPEQAIEARAALAASTGRSAVRRCARRAARLAVVELDPLAASVDDLRAMPVAATLLGRTLHAQRSERPAPGEGGKPPPDSARSGCAPTRRSRGWNHASDTLRPPRSVAPAPCSAPRSPQSPPADSWRSPSPGAASSGPTPMSTVGEGRLRDAARDPAARRVLRRRRRHAGVRARRTGRARPSSPRASRATPGASTAATSARRSSPSAASTCVSTSTNSLDEPTTVHWHGMHLPAEMDGGPHQMVEPGCHVVARVGHRPAGRDALVPPAPARRDRGPRRDGGSRACSSCDDPTRRSLGLPLGVRRRRRARSSCRTRASRRRRAGVEQQRGYAGGARRRTHRQRHPRPLPRRLRRARAPAAAERLDRAHLRLHLERRAPCGTHRDRRRAARGIRLARPACGCRPANAPRCCCGSRPVSASCCSRG